MRYFFLKGIHGNQISALLESLNKAVPGTEVSQFTASGRMWQCWGRYYKSQEADLKTVATPYCWSFETKEDFM